MTSKSLWRGLPLLALSLLSGCGGDNLVGRPDLQIVTTGDFPAPTRQDLILQQRAYVVGPFDKLSVDVFGAADLSRVVQVDANGQIALPLVGAIDAAGKTPAELSASVSDRLRGRYVRNPQVTVNAETISQTYTVDGQVDTPGNYPLTGRMTLIKAVASAKGLNAYARSDYIVVFRQVNNKHMAALYDLRAIRQGIYPDPEIFANDVILVGESRGSRLFSQVLASGALLTAPLVAILQ